jgi:magnesium-transporting ATPase (P-type)
MLWRLLLVHGRWNYMRIAEMVLYFFYKNMLFTIPQFIFAFYCAYSGQTIFDDIYISLYNLIFTALPLVIRAVFEQDVNYVRPAKEELNDASGSAAVIRSHILQTQYTSFVPPKYELNKYLFRLFPKMYFVGQESCIFNFKNFVLWIAEGIL